MNLFHMWDIYICKLWETNDTSIKRSGLDMLWHILTPPYCLLCSFVAEEKWYSPVNLALRQGGPARPGPQKCLKWGLLFLMKSLRAELGQFFTSLEIWGPGLASTSPVCACVRACVRACVCEYTLKCSYHSDLVVMWQYHTHLWQYHTHLHIHT